MATVWIDRERCTGCGACVAVCPAEAIVLIEGKARIDALRELGVRRVAPCHCTGARAQQQFATAYGTDYFDVGVGWTLVLGQP